MRYVMWVLSLWWGILSAGMAWNAEGHRLIAAIALAQLTPQQLTALAQYNQSVTMGYQPHSLVQAAVWLDWLHCHEGPCKDFRYYHYIDYPYAIEGVQGMPPRSVNALTAIHHALNSLAQPDLSAAEKGLQLRILMHVVGDLHQPMHAVSLYSRAFPQGDQGGNLFKLGPNRIGKQLHAYWDRGGGYLVRRARLESRVHALLALYPCEPEKMNLDPSVWGKESFKLASQEAYQVTLFERPSRAYQHQTRAITKQRLAVAGCRLGALLQQVV